MNKIIIFSALWISTLLASFPCIVARSCVVMSIGSDCEIAHQLRRKRLIGAYFPLDWVKSTNGDKVIELIKYNFSDFLQDKNLVERGINEVDNPPKKAVVDSCYNILFVHDFALDTSIVANEEVKDKYSRRIKRFIQVMNGQDHLFMFRKDFTKAQAQALSELIATKWPKLPFTLVVLNDEPAGGPTSFVGVTGSTGAVRMASATGDAKSIGFAGSDDVFETKRAMSASGITGVTGVASKKISSSDDWNIPHVRTFYLKGIKWPPKNGWEENNDEWDEIFKQLRLVR
jgi:hypothetical protein